MENYPKSVGLKNGTTAGIVILVIYALLYVMDLEMLASFWIGLVIMVAFIVLGFVTVAKVKGLQGGFISFKEAFSAYIIPIAIGLLIPNLFLFVLFNFIDPEAAATLAEISLEKGVEMARSFGAPESEIDKMIEESGKENPYSLKNIFFGYAGVLLFTAVIGLIAALTMKNNKDQDLG